MGACGGVVRYEFARLAPPEARRVRLAIRIDPPDGSVLLHVIGEEKPILCAGPLWIGTLSTAEGHVYLETQGSACRASLVCLGFEENES